MATSVYKLLQAVVTFGNAAGTLNNAALLQAVADPVGSTLSEHLTALAACCDWTGIRLLCLYVSPPSGPHSASDSAVTPLLLNHLRLARYPALAPDTLSPCSPLPGTCTRHSRSLLPTTTQDSHDDSPVLLHIALTLIPPGCRSS